LLRHGVREVTGEQVTWLEGDTAQLAASATATG